MTEVDESIKESITKVGNIWGGESDFNIEIVQDWKNVIYSWKKFRQGNSSDNVWY